MTAAGIALVAGRPAAERFDADGVDVGAGDDADAGESDDADEDVGDGVADERKILSGWGEEELVKAVDFLAQNERKEKM